MSNYSKIALAVVFGLCVAMSASAAVITVDTSIPEDTYNAWTLSGALAKAAVAPLPPPHEILIRAGSYNGANLVHNPTYVSQIYGDPVGDPGDVVFTAPLGSDDFLTVGTGLIIKNMTIIGYDEALKGGAVANVWVEDVVIQGASGYGIHGTTWNLTTVKNCTFDGLNLGIDLTGCTNGTFDGLTFTGGNYGLVLRVGSLLNILTGCTFDGLDNDAIWLNDANIIASGNLAINCGGYGLYKWGAGGYWQTDIYDNCFIDNNGGGVQVYNVQAVSPGFHHNYYSDNITWPGTSYAIGGGVSTDASPWINENNPIGPATVDVDAPLHIDVQWTIPGCAELDEVVLGAYNFTVTWLPASALSVDDADHSKTYFGENGSIYTPVVVDDVAGTAVFAATGFEEPGMGTGNLGFLDFTAEATGTVNISISSEYLDENGIRIPGGSTTLAVNVVDNVPPTITVVANDPVTGTDTYSYGSPHGGDKELHITGEIHDAYKLYDLWYRLYNGTTWLTWHKLIEPTIGGTDFSYGDFHINYTADGIGEGTGYKLMVLVRDEALNRDSVFYDFSVDFTGPPATNMVIADSDGCAEDGWTSNQLINVSWDDGGDAVKHQFYLTGIEGALTYENPTTYTLPATETSYTLYVRLYDVFNNYSTSWANDVIQLDMTAPVPVGFWINVGDPAKTNDRNVLLYGTNWDTPFQWKASEIPDDLDCDDPDWGTTYPIPFELGDAEGNHTVYLAVRDQAGNVSDPLLEDDIELDRIGPVINAFALQDREGEVCTEKASVNWHVEFDDLDVVEMWSTAIDPTPPPGDPGWSYQHTGDATPFDGSSPWDCIHATASVEGTNTRYIMLEDDVGNFSAPMSASIERDSFAPALTGLNIVDRAATDAPIYDSYSNEAIVNLDLSGLSADVVSLVFSQDNWTTADTVDITTADPLTYEYTYQGTPGECAVKNYVYVKSMDCAGRQSAPLSDWFRLDDEVPAIGTFSGPPLTNTFTGVPLTIAATDNCNVYKMRFSEDPDFVGAAWENYNTSKSFDLDPGPGDVTRTVYAQVSDNAGNISATSSISIDVDTQAPAGLTMTVQQDPTGSSFSGALAGYTNSATQNEVIGITADPDAVQMQVYTPGGTNVWTAMAAEYRPLVVAAGDGPKTVYLRFKDGAGNTGDWITRVINLDTSPPFPPTTASSMPGQSMDISWSTVGDAQSYVLGYVRTGEYPLYASGAPMHAMTMEAATLFDEVMAPETACEFDYAEQDIFAVSIWTKDEAGNMSTTPNTQVIGTNYILGDFYDTEGEVLGHDGWIDKEWEVVDLLLAYGSVAAGVHWNEYLDIHPTHDFTRFGYPEPDGDIDFYDLVFFGLNYKDYRLGVIRGSGEIAKLSPFAGAVTVTAEVPTEIVADGLYAIPITVDNAAGLAGYHVILDFNHDDFELVNVRPGDIYSLSGEHFFYVEKSSLIDVASVPFTEQYDGEEMFVIQLRSKTGAEIELRDVELTFVNEDVTELPVVFNTVTVARTGLVPNTFTLFQNYPNPFNASTNIQFGLPSAGEYSLTIYNVLGQVVQTFEGYAEAGWVTIAWDADRQATGIYLYRFKAGSFESTRKMVLLK